MSTHEPPDLPGCFSQAFVGRSVAIVAAYLMVTQGLDPDGALETIRKARPDVQYVPSSSESNVISLKPSDQMKASCANFISSTKPRSKCRSGIRRRACSTSRE